MFEWIVLCSSYTLHTWSNDKSAISLSIGQNLKLAPVPCAISEWHTYQERVLREKYKYVLGLAQDVLTSSTAVLSQMLGDAHFSCSQ